MRPSWGRGCGHDRGLGLGLGLCCVLLSVCSIGPPCIWPLALGHIDRRRCIAAVPGSFRCQQRKLKDGKDGSNSGVAEEENNYV